MGFVPYREISGRVVDIDGKVAIQHTTSNPFSISVNGRTYHWIPKNNVSLAWVEERDVSRVLSEFTRGCCGKVVKRFILASFINCNLWSFGTREYVEQS